MLLYFNICSLPADIIAYILHYFDIKELSNIACTSKYFSSIANKDTYWKRLCETYDVYIDDKDYNKNMLNIIKNRAIFGAKLFHIYVREENISYNSKEYRLLKKFKRLREQQLAQKKCGAFLKRLREMRNFDKHMRYLYDCMANRKNNIKIM